jgi:hypothetical protein
VAKTPVAYVNEDGDVWVERGSAPWPAIQREAAAMVRQMGDWDSVSRYEGIDRYVRVSDEREMPCMDEEDCKGCCRTIVAHHFRVVDPS